MANEMKVGSSSLRLQKTDVTNLEVDSFVYYAQHDLVLGSGFGTAIAMRGGPSIQEELSKMGPLETTQVAISAAGEMKSKYIVHAVGPRFQEEGLEDKLKATILNSLKAAEEKGVKSIAFPPMGAGFYGVPLDVSARITLETIKQYLAGDTKIADVVVCLHDNRELKPFESQLASMAKA
jgi:O-acetyl-ADP-ribose deacetylase (regulator of RNase III)